MPEQQKMSSFAKNLGVRVAEANKEHMNAPIDTGERRLPAGIRDGVALLVSMYTKEQENDKGVCPKGQTFFRASAIAKYPDEHDGCKVRDLLTSVVIPLCDIPEVKDGRKAVSFSQNWFEFQNLFRLLGIAPCQHTPQTDPTGQLTEAYFMAAMKFLTDPVRQKTNPVYISFTTRAWKSKKKLGETQEAYDKREPMVFETWHGIATEEEVAQIGKIIPGSDMTAAPPTSPPPSAPPTQPPTQVLSDLTNPTRDLAADIAETVAEYVDIAMSDKEGATDEGATAIEQLLAMAMTNGWTKEETDGAADWAAVGDMALNPPNRRPPTTTTQATAPMPNPSPNGHPTVGSFWLFAKRGKDGSKLRDAKTDVEFPSKEVEVVTSNPAAKTCTLKYRKDGKEVADMRSKKPVEVKWEWLEAAGPPY